MIGRLKGTLAHRSVDHVLVDVCGVGFTVYCSERTIAGLPAEGNQVELFTDLHVRQDFLQLFGFRSHRERELYRMLISVQGVGTKAALSILGALGVDSAVNAITLGDWHAVRSAHGIGPRIAQRIVNELKDKAGLIMAMRAESASEATPENDGMDVHPAKRREDSKKEGSEEAAAQARADALSAMLNLGYGQSEAAQAVAAASQENQNADSKALIREALKRFAPG